MDESWTMADDIVIMPNLHGRAVSSITSLLVLMNPVRSESSMYLPALGKALMGAKC